MNCKLNKTLVKFRIRRRLAFMSVTPASEPPIYRRDLPDSKLKHKVTLLKWHIKKFLKVGIWSEKK